MNSARSSASGSEAWGVHGGGLASPECILAKAKEICRTKGSGSPEYAAFVKQAVEGGGLSAGMMLPKYTPGDIKDPQRSRRKKKSSKSRGSLGGGAAAAAVVPKPERARSLNSTASALWVDAKAAGAARGSAHQRSVSETLFIEGLAPVVITTPRSPTDVAPRSGDPRRTSTGKDGGGGDGENPARKGLDSAAAAAPGSTESALELVRLRSLADQYQVVLDEKANVEGNLFEAHKRNEELKHEYNKLQRQHSDMTSEQEMINEQVAKQLQHLLKEKSRLVEENSKLRAENDSLQVLLEFAAGDPDSEDEADAEDGDADAGVGGVWDKTAPRAEMCDGEVTLQEISAWHPALQSKEGGSSSSGGASHFGDENDLHSPSSVDIMAQSLDKITIASCQG